MIISFLLGFKDFRFQDFKISNFRISNFRISRFQDFKISRFQDFRFQDFRFQDFKISDFGFGQKKSKTMPTGITLDCVYEKTGAEIYPPPTLYYIDNQ